MDGRTYFNIGIDFTKVRKTKVKVPRIDKVRCFGNTFRNKGRFIEDEVFMAVEVGLVFNIDTVLDNVMFQAVY